MKKTSKAGRPQVNKETVSISLSVSKEDKKKLNQMADLNNMNCSQFVRHLINVHHDALKRVLKSEKDDREYNCPVCDHICFGLGKYRQYETCSQDEVMICDECDFDFKMSECGTVKELIEK